MIFTLNAISLLLAILKVQAILKCGCHAEADGWVNRAEVPTHVLLSWNAAPLPCRYLDELVEESLITPVDLEVLLVLQELLVLADLLLMPSHLLLSRGKYASHTLLLLSTRHSLQACCCGGKISSLDLFQLLLMPLTVSTWVKSIHLTFPSGIRESDSFQHTCQISFL